MIYGLAPRWVGGLLLIGTFIGLALFINAMLPHYSNVCEDLNYPLADVNLVAGKQGLIVLHPYTVDQFGGKHYDPSQSSVGETNLLSAPSIKQLQSEHDALYTIPMHSVTVVYHGTVSVTSPSTQIGESAFFVDRGLNSFAVYYSSCLEST